MAHLPTGVVSLLNRQRGVGTSAQLIATGFGERRIASAVRGGRLVRIHRGGLVLPQVWGAADSRARHCLRLLAVQLATPDAVAWGPTSGVASTLPVLTLPELPVVARAPGSSQRVAGATVHRVLLSPTEREVIRGLTVCTRARTVVDVVGLFGFVGGLMTVDAALRRGVPRSELLEHAGRRPVSRGQRTVVKAIEAGDPGSESALESLSRGCMIVSGLLLPLCNVTLICNGRVYRVDFLWIELGIVGEADGTGKYQRSEDPAGTLLREKRRHEKIEEWTFRVIRWGYPEASGDGGPMLRRIQNAMAGQRTAGFVWPNHVRAEIRTAQGVTLPPHVLAEVLRLQRLGYPISVNDRADEFDDWWIPA